MPILYRLNVGGGWLNAEEAKLCEIKPYESIRNIHYEKKLEDVFGSIGSLRVH